jgi:hypothetical protein
MRVRAGCGRGGKQEVVVPSQRRPDGVRDNEVTLRVDEIVFRIHRWMVLARISRQR